MNTLIINWVVENWIILILGLLIIAAVIWMIINKKKGMLAEILLELMCEAERYLQSVPGELRKNEVILALYDSLPAWIHIFIKKKHIDDLIEIIFRESKELLDKMKDQAIVDQEFEFDTKKQT